MPGIYLSDSEYMYLVYTRYIPGVYFRVYVGIYLVYTRYIPGLEITRYIPGIYLLYTSYIAEVGLYPVYTRYIPGKFHFYRFQMIPVHTTAVRTDTYDISMAVHHLDSREMEFTWYIPGIYRV